MQWAPTVVATLILGAACSGSSPANPCGEGGERFAGDVGAVCAYAVVEGGFTCPTELPVGYELPGGGIVCAPVGTEPGDIPAEACRHLGHDDCGDARPFDPTPGGDGGTTGGDASLPVDAGASADAGLADAGEPRECDALEASGWSGETPWGAIDAEVSGFAASDCITISQAEVSLRTTGGERLWLGFSYPADSDGTSRFVAAGTFERDANVRWEDDTGGVDTDTTTVRVEVTTWAENPGDAAGHEIDVTITLLDARFGGDPFVVRGRFCEWAFLTC